MSEKPIPLSDAMIRALQIEAEHDAKWLRSALEDKLKQDAIDRPANTSSDGESIILRCRCAPRWAAEEIDRLRLIVMAYEDAQIVTNIQHELGLVNSSDARKSVDRHAWDVIGAGIGEQSSAAIEADMGAANEPGPEDDGPETIAYTQTEIVEF